MPNYILSRTSPPAHIYERKINLGYGVKVDVSDAPNQTQKGKEMQDANKAMENLGVLPLDPVTGQPVTAAFADGSTFDNDPDAVKRTIDAEKRTRADLEAQEAEDEANARPL